MSDAFFLASWPAASQSRTPLFKRSAAFSVAGRIAINAGASASTSTPELPRAARDIVGKHHTLATKIAQLALVMKGVPQCQAHADMLATMGKLNDHIIASYLEDRCAATHATAVACSEIDRFANAALSAVLVNLDVLTNAARELLAPQSAVSDLN